MQSYYSNLTSIILSLYVRWCHEGTVLYICRSVNIKKINCLNLSNGIISYTFLRSYRLEVLKEKRSKSIFFVFKSHMWFFWKWNLQNGVESAFLNQYQIFLESILFKLSIVHTAYVSTLVVKRSTKFTHPKNIGTHEYISYASLYILQYSTVYIMLVFM